MADETFSLEEWIPQHMQTDSSGREESFHSIVLKGFHEELHDDVVPLFRQLPSIRSPARFPLELRRPLAEYVGFDVPQIRKQTETEIRRQFGDLVDWIKLKPSELGIRTYLNSVGYFASVDIMFALEDYTGFLPWFDLPHDFEYEGYEDTPHALVTLSPFQPIPDDLYITEEIFEQMKIRLNRVYAIELVPHYNVQLNLVATENPVNFHRYGAIGSTTERWKTRPSPRLDQCHRGTMDLRAGILFEGSYANKIERWEAGFNEQLRTDAQNDVSLSDVSPPTGDILSGSNPETSYNKEEQRGEVFIDADTPESTHGELVNWLTLYDHEDKMAGLWTFPTVEILDDIDLNFFVQVLDRFTRIQARVSDAQPQTTFEGVETWLLDDYDLSYNEQAGLDRLLKLDQQWTLDQDLNTTYLATLRDGGYAWIGDSEGSDLPALDSNDLPPTHFARCDDLHMAYTDDLSELVLTLDLTISPLFGDAFDLIVLYDKNDNPVVVSKLDSTVTVEDQYDETHYQLRHQL